MTRPDRTLTEAEKASQQAEAERLEQRRRLAASLNDLADRVMAGKAFPVGHDHRFERTGWVTLRAAVRLIRDGDKARALAADWAARGYRSGTGGQRTGGPKWVFKNREGLIVDEVSVTGVEAASQQSDEWELTRDMLDLERRLIDDNATSMELRIYETVHVRPNEGRRSSIVDCVNCGEPALPRPKSGRCNTCYTYRYRTGGDRPTKGNAA